MGFDLCFQNLCVAGAFRPYDRGDNSRVPATSRAISPTRSISGICRVPCCNSLSFNCHFVPVDYPFSQAQSAWRGGKLPSTVSICPLELGHIRAECDWFFRARRNLATSSRTSLRLGSPGRRFSFRDCGPLDNPWTDATGDGFVRCLRLGLRTSKLFITPRTETHKPSPWACAAQPHKRRVYQSS